MRAVFAITGFCLAVVGCEHRAAPVPTPQSKPQLWTSCGELGCRQYDALEDAFRDAIALAGDASGGSPLVLAVGEAHAQRGSEVPSSASRFTSQLLPLLAGRASDLLVEIQNPPSGCAKVTKEVKKKQEVVTSAQAPTDQNEYVTMGAKARSLGIIPDLLRPTCADLDAIQAAGDEAIDVSLRTIERLTEAQVGKLLARNEATDKDRGKIVISYGGAIHNAIHPSEARAPWAFGPALVEKTHGRYVELDLYVPEFIDDTDAWKKLPFYSHYDRARLGDKTTVFRDGNSVVLVFALTRPR